MAAPARTRPLAGSPLPRREDRAARDRDDRQMFQRYRATGDPALREALVERFMPLARKLAGRYRRGGEPLEDLRQVASVGLLKAVDRYDPAHGTAFTSFAVPTILGELRRHFRDTGWALHVPRDLQELAVRLTGAVEALADALGRPPTVPEIAAHLEVSAEQVLEARAASGAHHAASLDSPQHDDPDAPTLADSLGAEDAGLHAAEDAITVERLLGGLDPRDREILRLRFAEDLTQSEIGERVGISQMHVSRRIRIALERLRAEAGPDDRPPALGGARRGRIGRV
jgi:RNA polymerase sigma-B factor